MIKLTFTNNESAIVWRNPITARWGVLVNTTEFSNPVLIQLTKEGIPPPNTNNNRE